MVDPILNLKGKEKIIVRMSLNPDHIISHVEFGTSSLIERLEAIIKLKKAGYKVGILIAPIILVDDFELLYEDLFKTIKNTIPKKYLDDIFFELIFMTYSFIHDAINKDAFPNAIKIYDREKFVSRGLGKYTYKKELKDKATHFFKKMLKKYFNGNDVIYIV